MKDQWFEDVSWNMFRPGEYVFNRIERELAIDENDSDFVKEMKTEKYNVYYNLYVVPNLRHRGPLARLDSTRGGHPKAFRLEKIDEFCGATGWTAEKVLNTALQDATNADGTPYQINWPDKLHQQMATKINKYGKPSLRMLFDFMVDMVPTSYRAYVYGYEGNRNLSNLVDYKLQKSYAGTRVFITAKEKPEGDLEKLELKVNTRRLSINDLPSVVEQTGLSPHLLLGLGDTPLLCKSTEAERVMDIFTLLDADLQRAMIKSL